MENKTIITDNDLIKNKYPISVLEDNIYDLSLMKILRTQILTPDFCVKYLLSEDYACCVEETYICDIDILRHQPHIKQIDLINSRKKLNLF